MVNPTQVATVVIGAVLSAGVNHETFLGQVETAMRNGASGVIAGRTAMYQSVAATISMASGVRPAMCPSRRSPGTTAPTPAGVPVKIRSPGTNR